MNSLWINVAQQLIFQISPGLRNVIFVISSLQRVHLSYQPCTDSALIPCQLFLFVSIKSLYPDSWGSSQRSISNYWRKSKVKKQKVKTERMVHSVTCKSSDMRWFQGLIVDEIKMKKRKEEKNKGRLEKERKCKKVEKHHLIMCIT